MADQYVIQGDESKVKMLLFQSSYSTALKKVRMVKGPDGRETEIEFEAAKNIVLDELRKGAHSERDEDYIRTALVNAQQRIHHNKMRLNVRAEKVKKWNNLTEEERQAYLSKNPGFKAKLENLNDIISDDYVDLCLTTCYTVSNLSVSSISQNRKPIIQQYFEPLQTQRKVDIQGAREEQKPKPPLGGIFND